MYKGVFDIFSRYWIAYGGTKALVRSPYFHAACILLLLTWSSWSKAGWWDLPIDVIPSLLGFTLGGFAMLLGFGDENFRALLAEPDEDGENSTTLYVSISSTFAHFIVVQVVSLIGAILAKSANFYFPWPQPIADHLEMLNAIFGAAAFLVFLYALTSVLAATMQLFRVATWYEAHRKSLSDEAAANSPSIGGLPEDQCVLQTTVKPPPTGAA